jgi:hypothetical protein
VDSIKLRHRNPKPPRMQTVQRIMRHHEHRKPQQQNAIVDAEAPQKKTAQDLDAHAQASTHRRLCQPLLSTATGRQPARSGTTFASADKK